MNLTKEQMIEFESAVSEQEANEAIKYLSHDDNYGVYTEFVLFSEYIDIESLL